MNNERRDKPPQPSPIPSRSALNNMDRPDMNGAPPKGVPWVLQQFFNGDIDLDKELASRFPQMPVMSLINLRIQGATGKYGLAILSTQDGAASVRVEVDVITPAIYFTFALHSMLAFRFSLTGLTDRDRQHWLEPMRREQGEVAFLWTQSRWRSDYVIAAPHKHFTNLFAFSPQNVEAAARLTSEVTRKLINWLDPFWSADRASASREQDW